jgi:tetratricopeptide (TPR) repeat protein
MSENLDEQQPPSADPVPATVTPATPVSADKPAPRRVVRAVGPRLRILLYAVFALLALLGANSGYLATVTTLEWVTGETWQNYFYFLMFLGHLVLGLLIVVPFLIFGAVHMRNTRNRRNRRAVRVGYALFTACIVVLATGLMLVRISGVFDIRNPAARSLVYWLHVACPVIGGWLYWLHRLVGPKIKWKVGLTYGAVVVGTIAVMVGLHSQDPRQWNMAGSPEGEKYFEPSPARTVTGNFIPAKVLQNDDYCKRCHVDAHADWASSAHRFSSFNNPAYRTSVRETRAVSLKRDGDVRASRWCAGCHDPVPFFSGAFDQVDYDDVNDPTAHAGITCTVCHAITNVNSNTGNADFTIEEPLHYPFAFSKHRGLQWINEQLIKAKPAFHKKTFLKPFHKTEEFCGTCHKVSLPFELNHYKKFLRGQNHYDSYLLSGVSGHGTRSFYYPPKAQQNCNGCHMPLRESTDFGAKIFDDSGKLKIHDHLTPGANTAIGWWLKDEEAVRRQQEFLAGSMRVDIFGIRDAPQIDARLTAPLRPEVPVLEPGKSYLLETVIRTVKLGHLFTQGTVDSNDIWLEVVIRDGDQVIARSGDRNEAGDVDPAAHRVNVFLLDKNGNRINRRNAQDIFTPLYNNQMPPGAGQTVHYELNLPDPLSGPLTVDLQLNYRKFDAEYLRIIQLEETRAKIKTPGFDHTERFRDLPITVLASDRVVFPVLGSEASVKNEPSPIVPWQRWNDFGIGLLLKKQEKDQAIAAFKQVEALGRYDGPLNLARIYPLASDVPAGIAALTRAAKHDDPPAPPWTVAALSGMLNRKQSKLLEAEKNFRAALEMRTPETERRGFDFSRDYGVRNLLGLTLFDLARQIRLPAERPDDEVARKRYDYRRAERDGWLASAEAELKKTLEVDSENVTAHYLLSQVYNELGQTVPAKHHRDLYDIYRKDDTAQGLAVDAAKQKYPEAAKASEKVVIYQLHSVSK